MDLATWQHAAPAALRADVLWKRQDYRIATFVASVAWADVEVLAAHPGTRGVSGQLYDAVGSVPANIAEGYSRGSPADRVRFYEYALGSAREARDWYERARPVLGDARVDERHAHLTSIVRLLLTVIAAERRRPRGPAGMGTPAGTGDPTLDAGPKAPLPQP